MLRELYLGVEEGNKGLLANEAVQGQLLALRPWHCPAKPARAVTHARSALHDFEAGAYKLLKPTP